MNKRRVCSLKDISFVKAKNNIKRKVVRCSYEDTYLTSSFINLIFIFPRAVSKENFTEAVTKALDIFPEYAGRLVEKDGNVYIDYDNKGVKFSYHRVNLTYNALMTSGPYAFKETKHFIDRSNQKLTKKSMIESGLPTLTIRLTYLKNSGMVLGISASHIVGDGQTIAMFLKTCSDAAKNLQIEPLCSPLDREKNITDHMSNLLNNETIDDQTSWRIIKSSFQYIKLFLKLSIRSRGMKYYCVYLLKKSLNEFKLNANTEVVLSSHDIVCAHLSHSLMRSCSISNFFLAVLVNYRNIFELPENLAGNLIGIMALDFNHKSALSSHEIADYIHKERKNFVNKYFHFHSFRKFIDVNGGFANIDKFVFGGILEKLVIVESDIRNLDVSLFDFGEGAPSIVIPYYELKKNLFGQVFCSKGPNNDGLLLHMILPKKIGEKVYHDLIRKKGFSSLFDSDFST